MKSANKLLRQEILSKLRELLQSKRRRIYIGKDRIGRARYKTIYK